MCASSAIYDYGMRNWPSLNWPQWTPSQTLIPNTTTEAERRALEAFRELVRKAEEFDAAANQPDCEDPAKATVMERVLARLEAIEKQLGIATT